MNSRDRILVKVKASQPALSELPSLEAVILAAANTTGLQQASATGGTGVPGEPQMPASISNQPLSAQQKTIHESNALRFQQVLESIGGKLFPIYHEDAVRELVATHFEGVDRIITTLPGLQDIALRGWEQEDPHILEYVQLAIIEAPMAVAENGAVWVTEKDIVQRVAPFICEHLAVVVHKKDIVGNMHQAYQRIAYTGYHFGVFIAGPSKTADIEQSLVLGAHGPKTMTIFLVE